MIKSLIEHAVLGAELSMGQILVSAVLILQCLVWTVLTCIEHISRDFSCMDISPHFLPCTILYTSEYKEYFFR
jgi:hypothetical protein